MTDNNTKKITNYTILLNNKLGEGAFGKVYIGQEDATKKRVAIKVLDKKKIDEDPYTKKALYTEIEIVKTLTSPNIVKFIDVMESNNSYYLIQQFCNGGELRKLMRKSGKLTEQQAVVLLKQICNGFVQLLRQGIMHRDLKPQNILMHDNIVKIADFGFCKKTQDKQNMSQVGTPLYMPLQILTSQPYSSKYDIWSLGCIFYEMLQGRTPWTGKSDHELICNISTKPIQYSKQPSKPIKNFIERCLGRQEKDRFSWDELLRHEIFQGYFNKKQELFENKYKIVMNNIKYMVKVKSIDFQKLFVKMGYSAKTPLNFQAFKHMMNQIDDEILDQQIKYTFTKINQSNTGSISFDEFQKALSKFSIPTSNILNASFASTKSNNQDYTAVLNPFVPKLDQKIPPDVQHINLKLINFCFKLLEKLKQKQMTINQVLDAYKCSQKGYVQLNDFDRLIKVIDKTFTDVELKTAFRIIDNNTAEKIPIDNFIKYFYKTTSAKSQNNQSVAPFQSKLTLQLEPKIPSNIMTNSLPPKPPGDGKNLLDILGKQMNPKVAQNIFKNKAPECGGWSF